MEELDFSLQHSIAGLLFPCAITEKGQCARGNVRYESGGSICRGLRAARQTRAKNYGFSVGCTSFLTQMLLSAVNTTEKSIIEHFFYRTMHKVAVRFKPCLATQCGRPVLQWRKLEAVTAHPLQVTLLREHAYKLLVIYANIISHTVSSRQITHSGSHFQKNSFGASKNLPISPSPLVSASRIICWICCASTNTRSG